MATRKPMIVKGPLGGLLLLTCSQRECGKSVRCADAKHAQKCGWQKVNGTSWRCPAHLSRQTRNVIDEIFIVDKKPAAAGKLPPPKMPAGMEPPKETPVFHTPPEKRHSHNIDPRSHRVDSFQRQANAAVADFDANMEALQKPRPVTSPMEYNRETLVNPHPGLDYTGHFQAGHGGCLECSNIGMPGGLVTGRKRPPEGNGSLQPAKDLRSYTVEPDSLGSRVHRKMIEQAKEFQAESDAATFADVESCAAYAEAERVCDPQKPVRPGDQMHPIPNNAEDMQTKLIIRLLKRRQIGISRYGTALQPFNNRDGLKDLGEELLDALVYTEQVRTERDELTSLARQMKEALTWRHQNDRGGMTVQEMWLFEALETMKLGDVSR